MRNLIILLLFCLLVFDCSAQDNLKSSSMSVANILKKAADRLNVSKSENVIEGGKIAGTKIFFNNTESKKYLERHSKELQRYYRKIKSVYLAQGPESFDALCVIAVLNDSTFFLSGEAIDEPCTYAIKLDKLKSNNSLSEWVFNEFLYKIYMPTGDSSWKKMKDSEKLEMVIQSLILPCKRMH
jgi:hypothetical protein